MIWKVARKIHTSEDTAEDTSYETYLRGELSTYSDKMLELYGRYVVEYARSGRNTAYEIMENSVKMYGYQDVETAEKEITEYESKRVKKKKKLHTLYQDQNFVLPGRIRDMPDEACPGHGFGTEFGSDSYERSVQ